jgi:hypothetical protein
VEIMAGKIESKIWVLSPELGGQLCPKYPWKDGEN